MMSDGDNYQGLLVEVKERIRSILSSNKGLTSRYSPVLLRILTHPASY
jgi:hypothetical protein